MIAPPTHLLDTSVYCQPIRRRPLASVEERWESLGDGRLCSSVICEAEIRQGLELARSGKLWKAYEEILEGRLPLLPVDAAVAHEYARLAAETQRRGKRRPALDLLVAATASAHRLVVATCNAKHFVGLGVPVEDWSK